MLILFFGIVYMEIILIILLSLDAKSCLQE